MNIKKLLTILLIMLLSLALVACGGGGGGNDENPDGKGDEIIENNGGDENGDIDVPEGYLATKTGKFYSQFTDGKMYMEYETEMEGMKVTMISATNGEKSYSETIMDGMSVGSSIIIGEEMYTIDHNSKMVMKMDLTMTTGEMTAEIIEEEDVSMEDLIEGTRIIDGKTYETEEWVIDGGATIMCFDGNDLAYMVGVYDGMESILKVIEISSDVDDSLFEIPADYTVMEF
ncbi:MAG: hypothetical protein IJC14_01845 [Firmicutes bacterium]|nr:hypothetical protein [Bacillota bacterium]